MRWPSLWNTKAIVTFYENEYRICEIGTTKCQDKKNPHTGSFYRTGVGILHQTSVLNPQTSFFIFQPS